MVQRIEDIKPIGLASHIWVGPYDEAKQQMESKGFREIDLAVNAKLRREYGKDAYVSTNGNRVKEDILILPGKKPRLARNLIISSFPVQATQASRTGEFYIDAPELKEAYEKALEGSVEIDTNAIPTKEFGKSKIAVYAFGSTYGKEPDKDKEDAALFGDFLCKAGIPKMPIIVPNYESKPFARKVWFRRLGDGGGSALDGNWDLYGGGGRVRGVCESAEGTAKNLTILPNEVKILKEVRAGNLAPRELEALIEKYS